MEICSKNFYNLNYETSHFYTLRFYAFNKCRELEEIILDSANNEELSSESRLSLLELILSYCIKNADYEFKALVKEFCTKNTDFNNFRLQRAYKMAFSVLLPFMDTVSYADNRYISLNLGTTIKKIYNAALEFNLTSEECAYLNEYLTECVLGIKIIGGKAYFKEPLIKDEGQVRLNLNDNNILINYVKDRLTSQCRIMSGGVAYSVDNLPLSGFKDIDVII